MSTIDSLDDQDLEDLARNDPRDDARKGWLGLVAGVAIVFVVVIAIVIALVSYFLF